MTSKIVAHQQMVEFINSQPDEKLVDFDQIKYDSPCGCVMIQYAREHKFAPVLEGVGTQDFLDHDDHRLELPFHEYIPNYSESLEKMLYTYKELKDHVNGNK